MDTSSIIPELDPARNIIPGFPARRVGGPVNQFDLQRPVNRFRQRIVIAYPSAPDGLLYSEFPQRVSELCGRVVASPVAVKPNSA
jgi:hypothetical protein